MSAILALPARLDDAQLALCDRVAALPAPPLIPAEHAFLIQCMRTLSTLPRRAEDETTAKIRLGLFQRHFGHLSREALAHLTERATATCAFFPTPKECFDILLGWQRSDDAHRAHGRAETLARREREARFDDLCARFRAGQVEQPEVDALSERWQRILVERGFLRMDLTIRPLPQDDRA